MLVSFEYFKYFIQYLECSDYRIQKTFSRLCILFECIGEITALDIYCDKGVGTAAKEQ